MTDAVEVVATAPQRKYPFINMRLADHSVLDTIEGRHTCANCLRSRKFFCYNCRQPVGDLAKVFPANVHLPVNIDIIKHQKEIDGKSTAVHAAILAKEHVNIYTYPDIPDYRAEADEVVLIFPSATSVTVAQLFGRKVRLKRHEIPKGEHRGTMMKDRLQEELLDDQGGEEEQTSAKDKAGAKLPIRKAVLIDSTWNQSRGIFKDPRIKCLRTVVLQNRCSQFWRHQRGSPRWYLATIEAVHQFVLELHVQAWGLNPHYRGLDNLEIVDSFYDLAPLVDATAENVQREAPYNGQYDNLMYFFANMYDLIHKYYDHNQLKSYKRPI